MNETAEQVRDTFHEVADVVPVPRFDEVGFRRAVRRSRRRRTGRVVGGAAVAAGVVLAVGLAAPRLLDQPPPESTPVAVQPEVVETLRPSALLTQPLYYTAQGRLRALAPDGSVHDLGLRSEAVVGSNAEGVLALDDESRLVWFDARPSGGGDGRFTFSRGATPVEEAVSSVAMSGDGRLVAWLATDGQVTVEDVETGEVVQGFEAAANSYVASVSDRGVLVSEDGDLVLRGAGAAVPVPTARDGYGWQADVAGDLVSVMDRDGVTRVYDVASGGTAELVAEVPGSGRLAPDGTAVVSAHLGGPAVRLWTDGRLEPLDALDDGERGESVGWLDEDHAVVTTGSVDGTTVRVCDLAKRACDAVLTSVEDVRLAE